MSNAIITCHNLIETNDGKFKSEKQKKFLQSQSAFGAITNSGKTFTTSWIEYFNLDEDGIISYQRDSNKKGLQTLWERGQKTASQKAAERHNKALAKHEKLEIEFYEIFKQDSIETFGYILDSVLVDRLYYAIQSCSLSRLLATVEYKDYDVVIEEYQKNIESLKEFEKLHTVTSEFMTKYRIMALGEYKSKFQYKFLSIM